MSAPKNNGLDKSIKALWLNALRSGEYTQTRFALRKTEKSTKNPEQPIGHCCLGVLIDVGNKEFIRTHGYAERLTVCDFLKYGVAASLAKLNDNDEKTFSEIADYIEQNL